MANNHSLFKEYNKLIKLSEQDREKLKRARNSLRERMGKAFLMLPKEDRREHTIEFQSQGSFVMDTIIKPETADYDLDDGVYFLGQLSEEERAATQMFHDLIMKAIDKGEEIEEIVDKTTCVRVKYFNKYKDRDLAFHIDLPIYYAENYETPELAHTKEGWIESNPVEFIAWFEEKIKSGFEKRFLFESKTYEVKYQEWLSDIRQKDCQLRRIVRYLKAWADLKRKEMPCGIIMTILAANNYQENERDDIALRDTLENINQDLEDNNFTCYRPTPKMGEDLFESTSEDAKSYFKNALGKFIESANFAINNPDSKDSCLKWKKHLGSRFPCHLAKDEIEGANVYAAQSIKNETSKSA